MLNELKKRVPTLMNNYRKFSTIIPSKIFLSWQFKRHLGYEMDWQDPVTFNQKLQWLKVNWHDSLATQCADKYEVRNFVSNKTNYSILNEVYGIYDNVHQIDLKKLPKSFILKATHSSGMNFVCTDKNKVNWKKKFKEMNLWLSTNYYNGNREWVYKDIKPRIICEKLLTNENMDFKSLDDYKFYCFNGVPHYCQVIRGRGENETIDFFDMDWNHMPFTGMRPLPNSKEKILKPFKYEKMIELSTQLSKDFPFVRVDFYYVNEEIVFGEMTFFPTSGMGQFYPSKWNTIMGELLNLNQTKNEANIK